MNVQRYWSRREAAGLNPLVYLNLFTLRGIEVLCPFLTGITPVLRDQTDQSSKWLAYANALGITEVERAGNGTIDLGIQLKTRGKIDSRIVAEFIAWPTKVDWHGVWVASTDTSGRIDGHRLEIRQGPALSNPGILSDDEFAAVLRVLVARDKPTGPILNMPNVWRNPPDVAAGQTEDTVNVILNVPDSKYPLFKEATKAKFVRKDGRAYIDTTGIGR